MVHPARSHLNVKVALSVAPSNPNTVYALLEDRDPTLYRSDDRGINWRVVSRNHDMAERAPYYVRFAVAPDDEDRLYFVSVRFSMSKDGGQSLTRVGFNAGGDNHDFWIDPSNPDRMMIAHDGGASITLTGGKSWTRVVLPIAQMYHVHTDTRVPYNLYGNRQDGSSYRMPSRSTGGGLNEGQWGHVGGCESGFAIPDTVDNSTVWSGCYDGGLEVYDVRTDHARNVRVWPEAGYGWRPADMKYRWNWTFPIAISPHEHTKVYVGSQVVHVTKDGGASWQVISPDLTRNDTTHQQSSGGVTTDNLYTFDGATLFALAESPVRAGVLWAGSNDGRVNVSTDGGARWSDVSSNIPKLSPWAKIVNIEPSHFDAGTAYLAADLHELDDLDPYIFKTTDFGKSWRKISETFPRSTLSFVHIVREDPVRHGLLFAGTENGLYVTLDDGARWLPLQTNLPQARVACDSRRAGRHGACAPGRAQARVQPCVVGPPLHCADHSKAAHAASGQDIRARRRGRDAAARDLGPRSVAPRAPRPARDLHGPGRGGGFGGAINARDRDTVPHRPQGSHHNGDGRGRAGAGEARAHDSRGAGQHRAHDQPARVGAQTGARSRRTTPRLRPRRRLRGQADGRPR